MLFAHIDHPGTYLPFLGSPVWQEALQWIKTNAHQAAGGIYELRPQQAMYVNVHGYDTVAIPECKFESHKRYIDLQYCISGGECIAWTPTALLAPNGEYNAERDFQFYKPFDARSTLYLTAGNFGVFFPEDAHRPKQHDGVNNKVWKLVVKISLDLL